jgi:predicted tellurium resistance membrane protein TerC
VILVLVGAKMIAANFFPVPTLVMLGAVAGVLLCAMVASVAWPDKARE